MLSNSPELDSDLHPRAAAAAVAACTPSKYHLQWSDCWWQDSIQPNEQGGGTTSSCQFPDGMLFAQRAPRAHHLIGGREACASEPDVPNQG